MKCIKHKSDKKIIRASNEKAEQLVKQGAAEYVSKGEWKLAGKERG